jgi:hypothetical protein
MDVEPELIVARMPVAINPIITYAASLLAHEPEEGWWRVESSLPQMLKYLGPRAVVMNLNPGN